MCCCFVLFRLAPNYSCTQLPAAIIQTQLKLSILFNCTPVASWVRAWSATEIAIVPSLPNTQNNVTHTLVELNYRTGICKALVLDPSWEVSRAGREAPQGLAAKAAARFPYTPPGLPPWTKGGCFRGVVLDPDDPGFGRLAPKDTPKKEPTGGSHKTSLWLPPGGSPQAPNWLPLGGLWRPLSGPRGGGPC